MNDNEIKEQAKEILLDAWEDQKRFADPEKFFLRENSDGEIEFFIKLDEGVLGKCEIVYSPQIFFEDLIREAEDIVTNLVTTKASQIKIEECILYLERKIDETASILVRNMQREFQMTVAEQCPLALSIFYEGSIDIPHSHFNFIQVKKALEDFGNQRKTARNFFVKEIRQHDIAAKVLFSFFYEMQLEEWKKAKACYKKNKQYRNCLEMVKLEFPELLPDLIDKFAELDKYASQPSTLALLSTARITNVPKSISSIRSLQKYLKESKELWKTMPSEDIEREFYSFYDYRAQKQAEYDRMMELLEQEEKKKENSAKNL